MVSDIVRFEVGDIVFHPSCKEWGSGKVKEVQTATHEGRLVQRLRIDFSNAGSKWLNTGIAPLKKTSAKEMAEAAPKMRIVASVAAPVSTSKEKAEALPDKGWLDELEAGKSNHSMPDLWSLPAPLTDIMRSPEERLRLTADAYKFSHEPGPLFQWAVVQSGLDDPLSRYSRMELEQAFFRYSRLRDDHLFDLCRQLKRESKMQVVKEIMEQAKYRKAKELLEKTLRW